MAIPNRVRLVEVGPRDGLQNEPEIVPTETKARFIHLLAEAGHREIEVTSFVHPDRIPQLADAEALIPMLEPRPGLRYSALVPNRRGLERAIRAGVPRIAVFTAASESFNQRNINMGVHESIEAFRPLVEAARAAGLTARGYVSTCWICPYEGFIKKEQVRPVVEELLALGVDEVSVGDTIGGATPPDVQNTLEYIFETCPVSRIAGHFHDTYGMAIANVYAALQLGVATFDSSAGGIGGCPYAPGALGNVATEDVLYLLDRLGVRTGVRLDGVRRASEFLAGVLGRPLPARILKTSVGKEIH